MDIQLALDEMGGAARRTELLRAGVPERAINRSVRDGLVERVGHGTYALPWAPPEVGLAALFRAQLGCVTACRHRGLPVWDAHDEPHLVVALSRSSSRRDPGELAKVIVHRTSRVVSSWQWVPLLQAIDQAGWCTAPVGQLVTVDAALHAGVLMRGDMAHFEVGSARRRAWLRRMASRLAESPLETVARVAFVTAGLAVEEQVAVPGVGRVDFVVEGAIAVEVDGWEFHRSRESFESDRARDRLMLTRGTPVLRFTARELRADPLAVVTQVAAVVERPMRRDTARRLAWAFSRVH